MEVMLVHLESAWRMTEGEGGADCLQNITVRASVMAYTYKAGARSTCAFLSSVEAGYAQQIKAIALHSTKT
jgi:hypothetical protein